jgi:acetate kinase
MRILVVNAGSSTLKLAVVGEGDEVIADSQLDDWAGDDASAAIDSLVSGVEGVGAVGHRVVHGGAEFAAAEVVTDDVLDRIDRLTTLAPLHQQRAVRGIEAARRAVTDAPHIACFDTAFHSTMPAAARTYAIPEEWRQRWGARRYGFHGLSHAWVARRAPAIAGRDVAGTRTVSCHLGAGASLCAIGDGASVDTTMGFTPLEGLVMATRSGSVDPGLLLWLQSNAGVDVEDVSDGLQRRGGLAALSGTDGDMRAVLAARDRGDAEATLAFDVYVHRLRREIAAMAAALGGIDVLAFTGGVGEHAAPIRTATAGGLGFLGVAVDEVANGAHGGDGDITGVGAKVSTVVVSAREDLEIAAQVRRTVRSVPPGGRPTPRHW